MVRRTSTAGKEYSTADNCFFKVYEVQLKKIVCILVIGKMFYVNSLLKIKRDCNDNIRLVSTGIILRRTGWDNHLGRKEKI
jgi:hypothetical protein